MILVSFRRVSAPAGYVAACMLFSLVLAPGCSDKAGDEDDKSPATRVLADEARVVLAGGGGGPAHAFDGLPGGDVPAGETPGVGFALRQASAEFQMVFGQFKIEETPTSDWRGVHSFIGVDDKPFSLSDFQMVDGSGAVVARGKVVIGGAGDAVDLAIDLTATGDLNRISAAFACRPDEHFLGLGGQSWDVDHRGWTVPLWVTEDGLGKYADDDYHDDWPFKGSRHDTHTPMPVLLSSAGYGLVVETDAYVKVSLCDEADEKARVEVWDRHLRLRLFTGKDPTAIVERMTAWLGRPKMPPPFAFGLWIDAMYGPENVLRVAKKLRDSKIPTSALWTEDWRGGYAEGSGGYTLEENWNVDPTLYPDLPGLSAKLRGMGFKFLTYNNTFLSSSADIFDEALAKGHSIKKADGSPYKFQGHKFELASLLDLTSPAARGWARAIYEEGINKGSDGWMADFCEWTPTDALFASGADGRLVHNAYPRMYHRLNRELLDDRFAKDGIERLTFVRSAWLGSQPLVDVVWAGDQQTDWSLGDGMPSVIPMGIGLGISGFPWYGHDIGGYFSGFTKTTTQELWYRWVTLGALSPVMRTHHGKSAKKNWNWESDAGSTAHMRRWASFHTRLFPYLWQMARVARAHGTPIMRPLALGWPDFEPGWTATDQYMLGDRLVVAPIIEEGATKRQVRLPAGRWYRLRWGEPGKPPPATGDVIEVAVGDGAVQAEAAVDDIAMYVPAGTVLPLMRDEITTLAGADGKAPKISGDRELWLWPGGDGAWKGDIDVTWKANGLAAWGAKIRWNDVPMSAVDGVLEVSGAGTLKVGESGTLTIASGQHTVGKVRIRLR